MSLLLCVFLPYLSPPCLSCFSSSLSITPFLLPPPLHFFPVFLLPLVSLLPFPPPSPTTAKTVQYNIARQMLTWSSIAFHLAVIINILVALFYPFDQGNKALRKPSQMSNVC